MAPEKTLAIGDSLGNIPSRSEDALLLLKRINAFESPINFESVEKSTDPSTPSLNDQIGTSKYTLIPNTTHYDAKEEAKNTLRRIMSYHKLDSPQKALKMLQDGTAGVLPRIELLNEILRAIVNSSEDVKDAEILMKNMYNTCKIFFN